MAAEVCWLQDLAGAPEASMVLLMMIRHVVKMPLLFQEVDAATAESAGDSTVQEQDLHTTCGCLLHEDECSRMLQRKLAL